MNEANNARVMKRANIAAAVLLLVGLMQMAGDLLKVPALKGVGAAIMCSPAPKVFTAHRGLETYSTRFFLEWTDRSGKMHALELRPEVYQRMQGPYNRRNIYGAVLAFGPVLATDEKARPMFLAVSRYALAGEAPLLRELGIDPADVVGPVRVRYEPVPGSSMGNLPRILEVESR